MEKVQTEIIERNVIDEKTIASKIKYRNTMVYVKSIFGGVKYIDDVLFNIAKERMNRENK
ncbi:MAG: hypothetical protein FWD71_09710 [Oscillospiraceae bacterium]|nr:hypothetical protein [Oscillospiraceae bacterium]